MIKKFGVILALLGAVMAASNCMVKDEEPVPGGSSTVIKDTDTVAVPVPSGTETKTTTTTTTTG